MVFLALIFSVAVHATPGAEDMGGDAIVPRPRPQPQPQPTPRTKCPTPPWRPVGEGRDICRSYGECYNSCPTHHYCVDDLDTETCGLGPFGREFPCYCNP